MPDKTDIEKEGFAEKLVDDLKQREEALKISVKEAASYSLMDGFGLRFITPYALALNASKLQIGFLSSLPALFANFSQIFTPRLMEKHARKKIVFLGLFIQAVMWLVLIGIGALYFFFGYKHSGSLLVLFYTLLILASTLTGPAWSSWMKDLTQGINSGEYFAKRAKVAGAIALICMLLAGFLLDYFKHTYIFVGFGIIFFLAFLGRLGSSLLIRKQYEPEFKHTEGYYFSFIDFVKKMLSNNFGRFVFYTAIMAFAVNFAAPFFAVYMLSDLGFSYLQYTIITISPALTALLFMTNWGKFADKYGNFVVLKITGVLIVAIPFFWIFSYFFKNIWIAFAFLLISEGISGFAWAGYNLSAGNYIYDAVTKQRMALCVAYFSIIHGIMAFLGATIGGYLASLNISLFGINSLLLIFLVSGIFRFAALIGIRKKVSEVRKVQTFSYKKAREEFRLMNPSSFFAFVDFRLLKQKPY